MEDLDNFSIHKLDTLSVISLAKLSENRVRKIFQEIKYKNTDGKPYCPHCGSFDKYNIKATKPQQIKYNEGKEYINRWKCKNCNKHYSLMSGTIFENHKYPLRIYLSSIFVTIQHPTTKNGILIA